MSVIAQHAPQIFTMIFKLIFMQFSLFSESSTTIAKLTTEIIIFLYSEMAV